MAIHDRLDMNPAWQAGIVTQANNHRQSTNPLWEGWQMPTVLRIGKYRFHFYSNEGDEPPHIHVRSPEGECKFWLDPVELARNNGIAAHELSVIDRHVFEHRIMLKEKYHEIHGF